MAYDNPLPCLKQGGGGAAQRGVQRGYAPLPGVWGSQQLFLFPQWHPLPHVAVVKAAVDAEHAPGSGLGAVGGKEQRGLGHVLRGNRGL